MVNVSLNAQKVNTKTPLTTHVIFVTKVVMNVMDLKLMNVSLVMVNFTYSKENVLNVQVLISLKNQLNLVNLVTLVVKAVLHMDLPHVLLPKNLGI